MLLAMNASYRRALFARLLLVVFAVAYPFSVGRSAALESADPSGLLMRVIQTNATGAALAITAADDACAQFAADDESGPPQRPLSRGLLWAVPFGTERVTGEASETRWRNLNSGELPDSVVQMLLDDPQPLLDIAAITTMRGLRFAHAAVNALQPNAAGDGLVVCEAMRIDLRYEGQTVPPDGRLLSATFNDLARHIASNLDEVAPVAARAPEPYLIITRPAYEGTALQSLVNWKRSRGHTVTVATTTQTGTTAQQIKTYIQTAYDTWSEPPLFVLLIGDVDGQNAIPGWLEQGYYRPTNISDNPYTLLDGNDYLPDVLIGRLSVDTITELLTVVNKCITYENAAFQPDGAWRSSILLTGVRSSPGFFQTYNSAWPTLQWIGRQFRDVANYQNVYEVPYPGGSASQINQRINSGVSFIAYRGFGAPSNWAYPPYDLSNINTLSNGAMLPVVTSIVCGGGAFDSSIDPCFGELWVRAGTPSTPKGAVGFIGPSELDTKTRWNNTIIAGIYEGILFENVSTLGAAMLRGKLELLRQFPNNVDNLSADANRSVAFYFTCYNLLGDPGLALAVGSAGELTATVPDSLPVGSPTLTLHVTQSGQSVADVWGTVMRSDSVISRALSDEAGFITLALPQTAGAALTVHLHKARYRSRRDTLRLVQRSESMGLQSLRVIDDGRFGSNGNGDGMLNPGETAAVATVLRNFGTAAFAGGTLTITATTSGIIVLNSPRPLPALPPGGTTDTLYILAAVARNGTDGQTVRLRWSVAPIGATWETAHEIFAPRLIVSGIVTDGADRNPVPNAAQSVALTLTNTGRAALISSTITLRSRTARLTLTDSTAVYPAIAPHMQAGPVDGGFVLSLGDVVPGDWAETEIVFGSAPDAAVLSYLLPIGNLTGEDPTHPDTYGYRAYQSGDTAYAEAPAYAWLEIDPTRGGQGTVLSVPDVGEGYDTTVTVNLPFPFTFYGQGYNRISICANGFVSFGETRESYFRNYALPAIASPDNMVCVFWDDLFVPPTGRICTLHDLDAGRFVIEWSRLTNQYGTGMEATFELVLYDTACWPTRTGDGDLLMQYLVFNNSDSWDNQATIGIQDRDAGHSLQISYAGDSSPGVSMLRASQAILFTTGRPESRAYYGYAGNLIDDDQSGGSYGNGDGIAQNGETVELYVRLRNTGNSPAPAVTGILRTRDPLLTLPDTTVSFPLLAPGESAYSNPLRVVIAPHASDGHFANLTLRLSGNSSPCVITPAFTIAGPALTLLPPIVDDDATPPSAGNGNGEWNSGEILELWPQAVNSGGNAAGGVTALLRPATTWLTLLDTIAVFGRIESDCTRIAADPFLVQIRAGTPDGTNLALRIICRDSIGNEWTNAFTYRLVQPRLSAAGLRAADPPPGGNNDGRLTLGERGLLFPAIANTGSGSASGVTARLQSLDPFLTVDSMTVDIGIVSAQSQRETATPLPVAVALSGIQPRIAALLLHLSGDGGIVVLDTVFLTIGNTRFADDFETDANYWSAWGTHLLWHRQTEQAHSPVYAYYCGSRITHEYLPGADEYLRSPPFVFNGQGTLVIQTRFSTADAGDVCRVQLQTGPSIYHTLEELRGSSGGWQERRFSLAGLPANDYTRVRFWFSSDFSNNAEGWYLDDVAVLDEEVAVDERPVGPGAGDFALAPCYPNPFNSRTTITFSILARTHVRLVVFDIAGRQVTRLVDGDREAGLYSIAWQPLTLGSGLYFLRLETATQRATQKVVYLR